MRNNVRGNGNKTALRTIVVALQEFVMVLNAFRMRMHTPSLLFSTLVSLGVIRTYTHTHTHTYTQCIFSHAYKVSACLHAHVLLTVPTPLSSFSHSLFMYSHFPAGLQTWGFLGTVVIAQSAAKNTSAVEESPEDLIGLTFFSTSLSCLRPL